MHNVTYHEKLKQVPSLYRLAEQASTYLNEVISKRFAPPVSVMWNYTEDGQGQAVLTMTLKGEVAEVTGRFEPKDFETARTMKSRMREIWDDLLSIQAYLLLENLAKLRDQAEDGHGREEPSATAS